MLFLRGEDLVADAARDLGDDENLVVLAHPAGATRFLCNEFRDRLKTDGAIVHERVRPEQWHRPGGVKVAVTYRMWRDALKRFDRRWASVRNPLKHVYSTAGLFRVASKRGMILGKMLGDGLPRGPLWAHYQAMDPHAAAMMSLIAYYHKVELSRPERLYRVEDVARTVDKPSGTHRPKDHSWDYLFQLDPANAEILRKKHEAWGYDT